MPGSIARHAEPRASKRADGRHRPSARTLANDPGLICPIRRSALLQDELLGLTRGTPSSGLRQTGVPVPISVPAMVADL